MAYITSIEPNVNNILTGVTIFQGSKDFTNRPTVNGQGVMLIGEGTGVSGNYLDITQYVTISGTQNIVGQKSFSLRPYVNGTGVLLSGEATNAVGGGGGVTGIAIDNNPSWTGRIQFFAGENITLSTGLNNVVTIGSLGISGVTSYVSKISISGGTGISGSFSMTAGTGILLTQLGTTGVRISTPARHVQNFFTGPGITMTANNVYYDAVSGVLTEGTWVVNTAISISRTASTTIAVFSKLWTDGETGVGMMNSYSNASQGINVPLSAIITVPSNTSQTWIASVCQETNTTNRPIITGGAQVITASNYFGPYATYFNAYRIY